MRTTYIALLRGINVGGHKVKMGRLRGLFTDLGFDNIRSYSNSGNIFFETDSSDREQLATTIEQHLFDELGYTVPAFLRTPAELDTILLSEPFKKISPSDDLRFCIVFTKEPLDTTLPMPIRTSRQDMDIVAMNSYEACIVWHIINGRPPSGKFPASILPAMNTTRFFHTLRKIRQAAA